MNFGYKSGVSYFAMNDKKDKVGEPKNVLPEEFFKGKKAYFYMSSQLLKPAKDGMEKDVDDKEKAGYQTADEKISLGIIKTFIENIDYIEGYYEGGGKSTLHLVMKDNKVHPLSVLLDAFIDISEEAAKMAEDNHRLMTLLWIPVLWILRHVILRHMIMIIALTTAMMNMEVMIMIMHQRILWQLTDYVVRS